MAFADADCGVTMARADSGPLLLSAVRGERPENVEPLSPPTPSPGLSATATVSARLPALLHTASGQESYPSSSAPASPGSAVTPDSMASLSRSFQHFVVDANGAVLDEAAPDVRSGETISAATATTVVGHRGGEAGAPGGA